MTAMRELLIGLAYFVWDHPHLLRDLLTPAPPGRTLRERYPPAPGAYVTWYSSIELTEEWFVKSADTRG
jgi:hypothetical protein